MAADTAHQVEIDVCTAAATVGPVPSSSGAQVIADRDWSVLSQAQFIFVCSSREAHADLFDAALIHGLRHCHRHGGWVIGLGTGVSALGKAGLLAGRHATAHPAQLAGAQAAFPDCRFSLDPFKIDGRVATAVGGDSVTDMMLELLSQCFDLGITESVRRRVLLKPGRSQSLMASIGLRGGVEGLDPRLVRFIEIVEQTLSEPQPLHAVCRVIGVSSRTLTRMTQRSFGCAPGALSSRIRLNFAADLLRTTTQSLQEIAAASGYRSTAQFSDSFRKTYSLRPGQYRQST